MSATSENIAGARIFRLAATSGLITGTSAGDVAFAFRNPSLAASPVAMRLLFLALKWRTVAGFTSAQELALAAHIVTSFGLANYTGGTDLSKPDTNPAYLNTGLVVDSTYSYTTPKTKSVLASGNVRIATTGALTQGAAPTVQSQPFAWEAFSELAAAATVQKGLADIIYAPDRDFDHKLDFGADAGFVVKLPIALGAGGTGRLSVEAIWAER
jgi:hypothetical protein